MLAESPINRVELLVGSSWPNISNARQQTEQILTELRAALVGSGAEEPLDSEDLSVIAFGSLARYEWTRLSDIDWTLLVDGAADPNHFELKKDVHDRLNAVCSNPPGREGTFGGLIFSHDLVHLIGGEDDTNRNTTLRCLMLLESVALGRKEAHQSVIRAILKRYLIEDPSFAHQSGPYRVPRFLLNDFARYWRTMTVDFAYKRRDRYGKGTALRNLKLRISRKLLFASGLLACFACQMRLAPAADKTSQCSENAQECVECLREFLELTPLDIVALYFAHICGDDEPESLAIKSARRVFDTYDKFLGVLADRDARAHLENLEPDQVDSDERFRQAREMSHEFNKGILDFFFNLNEDLSVLTRFYGVF